MLYLNKFSLILFITMISGSTFTQEIDKPLPVLKTKQSLNNIRFISSDGKLTYFQRRSGDLQLSKNYLNYEIYESLKYLRLLDQLMIHKARIFTI